MKLIKSIAFGWLVAASATIGSSYLPSKAGAQRRGSPRVIQLDDILIEGRVQKPNAFYILNRSSLGYEVLDLRTSFLREILRAVRREPF